MAQKPNPESSNAASSESQSSETRASSPQPTAQLPVESAPVSANTAASGGATGLDEDATRHPSVFRRHPLATGIAAAAIAVVLVSGLTAWGVGEAVASSLTSSTSSEMPMGTPTTAPATGGKTGGQSEVDRIAFRATIQSIDGSSWTILTRKGQMVTVAVDSSTQFGTKKTSETAGSFAVGDSVVIVATRGTDGTPIATRVAGAPSPMPSMPPMTPDPNA